MRKLNHLVHVILLVPGIAWSQVGTTSEDDNNESRQGDYSTYIGSNTGLSATSSSDYNTAVGSSAGRQLTSGDYNAVFGYAAGYSLNADLYNVMIGSEAGRANSASNNTMIGYQAGYNNTGSGNIFLGKQAGFNNLSGSNQLFIDNSTTNSPLIWGDFSANRIKINGTFETSGKVGIGMGTSTYPLEVSGDARLNNGWLRSVGDYGMYNNSDGTYWYSDNANYMRSRSDRGIIIANRANTIKGYIYHDNSNGFGLLDGDGNWGLRLQRDSHTSFLINNSEKMRILSSGNVGIGNTAPAYRLHTSGDIYADGGWLRVSGNRGIYFESYGGGFFMSDNTWIRTYNNKNFYHNTGIMRTDGSLQVGPDGDRFIVQTDGTVGINTTSPSALYKLDVNGSINASGGDSDDWNTAFTERGSQIAGTGLNWSAGQLNVSGVNTDDQTLSLALDTLYIEDGNYVDLTGYLDNTDNQFINKLSLNGTVLEMSLLGDGLPDRTVDLVGLQDDLGDHQVDQHLIPNGLGNWDLGTGTDPFGWLHLRAGLKLDSVTLLSHYHFGNTLALGLHAGIGGIENTSLGTYAMQNTTGSDNVAVGHNSLKSNTTGASNVAVGHESLLSNTTGYYNTAVGKRALRYNTTGISNVSIGRLSLQNNQSGNDNVAVGYLSSWQSTTGIRNSTLGSNSMGSNTTGSNNTAVGYNSLSSNTTGSNNTAVGYGAGTSTSGLSNTTAIGNGATTTASNSVRVGNTSVTSIGGQVSWSTLSDGRFKSDVKNDVSGLEFINALNPVSYRVDRGELDLFLGKAHEEEASKRKSNLSERRIGFVAQEVQEVIDQTGFVFDGVEKPQHEGDHYSIRYAEFVVPLTKAVQELNTLLEEQNETIASLQAQLNELKGDESQSSESGVERNLNPGESIELLQNRPNPFSEETHIEMSIPRTISKAEVIIYDLRGTQLKTIPVNTRGATSIRIEGYELEAGMYIYALITDGTVFGTKKMILTK